MNFNSKGLPCKILLAMKLTTFLLIVTLAQVSAEGFGQKVTLHIKNSTLETVLKAIEKQSGYHFLYDKLDMPENGQISVEVSNVPVEEALDQIFTDQPLTYKIFRKTIVVKRKKELKNIIPAAVQQHTVRGNVTDENGLPLPGVTVLLKGTPTGSSTGVEGDYAISAPSGDGTLVFSYMGFQTTEVSINNQSTINITLLTDVAALESVVVTALGITREAKSLTYATQNVKASELTGVRDPNNILNSFQGKIANALITQSSGGVGSDARIVLRGNRSIQGSNSALIVVDGVPNNSASNINPDDIESVTILRGASAGALYGSQAGNGVIVITTKKGAKDKVSVSINSGIAFESPFALPGVQNTYGQGSGGTLDPASGSSWGAEMSGQAYTNYLGEERTYSAQPDNIRDFFRNGTSLNNSIGISGGTEKVQTYLSYTNNKVQGIIPGNDLMRHNVNLRLTNQISKRFSTDAKVTYFSQDIENRPRSGEGNTPVLNIYQIPRNVSTEDARHYQVINNVGVPAPAPWPSTLRSIYGNPYWSVNNDILGQSKDQITGFLTAKYQISDWLSITGRANLDRSFERHERKTHQGTLLWATQPGGYYSKINIVTTQKWFDAIFEGNNRITEDLKVNYHAGAIYQDNRFDQSDATANGLNVADKFSLNFAANPLISSSGTQIQTQSVFGQVNLSYKDAIYLDASLRNDWDSRLPAPHSFQYYSAGVSGILSDLLTLPESISFLKASINYAEVGNGGRFGLLTTTYNYAQGAGNGYLTRNPVLPIPGLKPETVKNLELGIEAGILNDRLGFTLTYYKSNSFNQLLTISLPVATGYSSRYINAGNIQNQGVELVLNGTPVESSDFSWDLALNMAFNRNKVIELSDNLKVVHLGNFIDFGGLPQVKVGGSFGDLLAHQWKRHASGKYQVTPEGKPLTTNVAGEEPGYIGNFNPKANLGLTNTFNYKGISLRVLVDGRFGGVMISGTEQNLAFNGITEGTEQHREGGWNLGGVDADGQPVAVSISAQDFWQTASGKRFGVGEFFAYDATSFRVRELSLGYHIPVPSGFLIKSARLSLVARNLCWLYRGSSILDIPGLEERKMWFDPDMSLGNGNNLQGIEYGAFPSTRSMGLNLHLTF